MCELTQQAMDSLRRVADELGYLTDPELTDLELRTLLWSRCALAALYGIRVDEEMRRGSGDPVTG